MVNPIQGRALLRPLQQPLYDTEAIGTNNHKIFRSDLEIASSELMVAAMPKNHRHIGDLNLSGCRFENLPDGLRVTGDLVLCWCKNLKRLPRGLVVKGQLFIEYCPALKSFPAGAKCAYVYTGVQKYSAEFMRRVKEINTRYLKRQGRKKHLNPASLTFFQRPMR